MLLNSNIRLSYFLKAVSPLDSVLHGTILRTACHKYIYFVTIYIRGEDFYIYQ